MNLFYKKTSDNKGFTLIEIIAVLIILGIMAAVAVSRMGANQSDLIPQVNMVKSHLRFAQLKALADDSTSTTTWGIDFKSGTPGYYTLQNNGGNAPINLLGHNSYRYYFTKDGSSTSEATGVTVSDATVTFDAWGSPTGSSTVQLSQAGATPITITITPNTGYIP